MLILTKDVTEIYNDKLYFAQKDLLLKIESTCSRVLWLEIGDKGIPENEHTFNTYNSNSNYSMIFKHDSFLRIPSNTKGKLKIYCSQLNIISETVVKIDFWKPFHDYKENEKFKFKTQNGTAKFSDNLVISPFELYTACYSKETLSSDRLTNAEMFKFIKC